MTMNNFLVLMMVAAVCVLTRPAVAADSGTQSSIDQMKELMTTPSERENAIANDSAAQAADQKAGAFGPAAKEGIYAIAADIAGTMASKDPEGFGKSAESLKMTDPKALFDSLTPEQQKAIQRLANEIANARK